MTETHVIQQARKGDRQAFETLVKKYQGMVYGHAYHRLGRFADAQDVAQDVFLEAFQELNDLRDPARFAGWLRGITANFCKRHARNHRAIFLTIPSSAEDLPPASDPTPEERLETREFNQSVSGLLEILSEKNRLVVTLHYLNGLSFEEIGQMLDLPPGTVRVRLHRARQQLKGEIIEMVIKGFDQNQLDPEFADQVMKRIGVVGAEIGDKNGNLWLSTEDNQRFIIRMPRSEVQSIVEGQMPGILEHRKNMALVTNPDELPEEKEEDVSCFIDSLLNAFSLNLTGVILDAKEGTTLARAVVEGGGTSKTLPLKTRDAIALAGRMQAPLYATTRILDGVSFGEGVDPVPKQDAQNAIETIIPPGNHDLHMSQKSGEEVPDGYLHFVRNLKATDDTGQDVLLKTSEHARWQVRSQHAFTLTYDVVLEHEDFSWPGGQDEAPYIKEDCVFWTRRALFIASDDLKG